MDRFIIHESVDSSTLRLYLADKHSANPYEEREEFEAAASIFYETPDTVYISKALSKINLSLSDFKEIKAKLKEMGIKVIRYERRGTLKTEVL